jgi:mRNA-degrading endonuclease RelE of RelBE toxin-antitoxin system
LDQAIIKRIHHRLQELGQNPFDPRISGPVEMEQGVQKSREGDWRIFFEVDEANRIIDVLAVRPRQRAYNRNRSRKFRHKSFRQVSLS